MNQICPQINQSPPFPVIASVNTAGGPSPLSDAAITIPGGPACLYLPPVELSHGEALAIKFDFSGLHSVTLQLGCGKLQYFEGEALKGECNGPAMICGGRLYRLIGLDQFLARHSPARWVFEGADILGCNWIGGTGNVALHRRSQRHIPDAGRFEDFQKRVTFSKPRNSGTDIKGTIFGAGDLREGGGAPGGLRGGGPPHPEASKPKGGFVRFDRQFVQTEARPQPARLWTGDNLSEVSIEANNGWRTRVQWTSHVLDKPAAWDVRVNRDIIGWSIGVGDLEVYDGDFGFALRQVETGLTDYNGQHIKSMSSFVIPPRIGGNIIGFNAGIIDESMMVGWKDVEQEHERQTYNHVKFGRGVG